MINKIHLHHVLDDSKTFQTYGVVECVVDVFSTLQIKTSSRIFQFYTLTDNILIVKKHRHSDTQSMNATAVTHLSPPSRIAAATRPILFPEHNRLIAYHDFGWSMAIHYFRPVFLGVIIVISRWTNMG